MEVLRLGKQMAVGRQVAPSYVNLHRNLVSETGFVGAFYRGFMPWGLMQCTKGIPVLFVQSESMYQLQARGNWSPNTAEKASGFLGGAAQAVFVTPMQKIKVRCVMVMLVVSLRCYNKTDGVSPSDTKGYCGCV